MVTLSLSSFPVMPTTKLLMAVVPSYTLLTPVALGVISLVSTLKLPTKTGAPTKFFIPDTTGLMSLTL
jgi:hypothetical protein